MIQYKFFIHGKMKWICQWYDNNNFIFMANIITKLQLPKWMTVESLRFLGDLEWTVGLRMYHLFGQDGGQESFAILHKIKSWSKYSFDWYCKITTFKIIIVGNYWAAIKSYTWSKLRSCRIVEWVQATRYYLDLRPSSQSGCISQGLYNMVNFE